MSNAEKPSVLLVDDNEETCTLITAILHRDFRVETAGDGMLPATVVAGPNPPTAVAEGACQIKRCALSPH